ncbi:DUF1501 domain-containing protein [Stratiformator vulcanicus]|uniref:Sulfatase n=1 Tax=Stratiformator vulcanicus TaxID=2527980 RepID=A0A517R0N6_9PLAN|nr:DUF1501 domain-containing protein [Stratiformator vulcanicus]QDT37465.1 hypothetical protein Pan189_18450 [Stratiformator vulcanicus]
MSLPRRDFLYGLGATLGTAALNSFTQAEDAPSAIEEAGPLAAKQGHFAAKAKSCIFITLAGGPSHIDTFDPKPVLQKLHLNEFRRDDKFASAMNGGKRYYVASPFRTRQVGQSGLWMCDQFGHLPKVADELCIYRGCQAESVNHPTALYHINTGNRFGGDPAIGSWVTYGLGSLNQDLPGYLVMPGRVLPQGGAANWSSGYLPANFQGTPLRPQGSPILDLNPPPGVSTRTQRRNLDLLAELNAAHQQRHPQHEDLSARMASYELAFRMQMTVPEILDIGGETSRTLRDYGTEDRVTGEFGRKCLLSRKLIEKGVRFVQIYQEGWDSHDFIADAHGRMIRTVDQPIAALIADLKQRGLLDETLVVICGEFGRSPDNGVRSGGVSYGRDHNANAMSVVFAGGGVSGGRYVGATDEIGGSAVEVVHPIKDLHVTLLRMLGLDDNKLTYFHAGRFKQLSQVGGEVIDELMA